MGTPAGGAPPAPRVEERLCTHALGTDRVTRRDLFALELASFDALPSQLALPSPHFACLVAGDGETTPSRALTAFCDGLLRSGAVYVCSWGPGCRRLHEHFEDARRRLAPGAPQDRSVVTRCHETESLDDVLWYLVHLAVPVEAYLGSCRAALAVSVGAPRWSRRIRSVLSDLPRLDERVGATGGETRREPPESKGWARRVLS